MQQGPDAPYGPVPACRTLPMAAHFETKDAAVFNLTVAKSGTLGPKLRPHAEGPPCDAAALSAPTSARVIRGDAPASPETFPPMCDSFAIIRKSGGALMLAGYRNATMDMVAASLAGFVGPRLLLSCPASVLLSAG